MIVRLCAKWMRPCEESQLQLTLGTHEGQPRRVCPLYAFVLKIRLPPPELRDPHQPWLEVAVDHLKTVCNSRVQDWQRAGSRDCQRN